METDFRPAAQTPRHDVKRQFGPRVAHFCLHNPTFLLAKAADTGRSGGQLAVMSLLFGTLPRVVRH